MRKVLWVFVLLCGLQAIAQGGKAVLSNFRIENQHKNRIYFDSSVPISGSNTKGVTVTGKSISGISVNSGAKAGHYFTVSSAFTFWDNNTIRYEGGSDLNVVEFTLTYIENKIEEPDSSSNIYYVATNGSDGNNGTSLSSPFRTIQKAASVARAGSTVWVKAGNYGSENVSVGNSGTVSNPIKFIGYKNSPGDINSMYYKYGDGSLSASNMPLLDGKSRGSGTGFKISRNYVIVRNFQLTNYKIGIAGGGTGVIVENSLTRNMGNNSQSGYGIYHSGSGVNNRIIDCIAINGTMMNFNINTTFTLQKGCQSYSNEASGSYSTDYYYSIRNSYNILLNSYGKRDGKLAHTGHGCSVEQGYSYNEYNLIENLTSVNSISGLELRHGQTRYNVVRGLKSYEEGSGSGATGGVTFRDGTYGNVVENSVLKPTKGYRAFYFWDTKEQGTGVGSNNLIRNNVVINAGIQIQNTAGGSQTGKNNSFYNNTFVDVGTLIVKSASNVSLSNFEFKNNIVANTSNFGRGSNYSSGWIFESNNFYNGFNGVGTSKLSVNPNFVNESGLDFRLKSNSPLIDKGVNVKNVESDFDGNVRPQGKGIDIGAFEYEDHTTSSVEANAGSDVEICAGESVTLTASGGSSYEWSNGETTKSITVNPSATTTYTVTVSDNGASDSDTVEVTVNALPTVSAGADVTINDGDEVTLTASGAETYLWSTGATTASITVSPNSTTNYTVTGAKNGCEASDTVEVVVKSGANPPSSGVTANAGSDVEICAGESVTLTASGGSSYEWNNGETTKSITVNPSATTTYTVTVSDNGASDSDTVEVTVNALPTVSAGADVTINDGDEVILTASGAETYLWSTGATTASITVSPNSTTNYTVTGAKNGCEASDTVEVAVIPTSSKGITADAGSDVEICEGERVTLTASGGSSYRWSNGKTTKSIQVAPENTTTYSVTVYKDNLSDTDEVKVTVNELPTANAGSNITIYEGQSTILTASGGDNYLWNTGASSQNITVSPVKTSIYHVTVFNEYGCESSDSVQVTVLPADPDANAGADITVCYGESATLTGSGGEQFRWSTGETTKSIIVNPTRTTIYELEVTRNGKTDVDHITVTVDFCNNEEVKNDISNTFNVYPNPTDGMLNVDVKEVKSDYNIDVFSLNGSVVYKGEIKASTPNFTKHIDLSRFVNGVYIIRLYNANESYVKKVVRI